jgi:uroporphyrinogen decarboxylase
MRQAGRYQAEYQAIRAKHTFLEVCHTPELACKVTLIPRDLLDPDGLIIFSDILVPLEAMGLDLDFITGKGPVISNPVRSAADLQRLRSYDAQVETGFLPAAIRAVRQAVNDEYPVLGFAGAPYTLACYAIEGGTARHYHRAKAWMLDDPKSFDRLMSQFAEAVTDLLAAQIEAGASLVQLFDTWAGNLMPAHFEKFALPYVRRIIEKLKQYDVPIVYFMNGVSGKLELMAQSGADVIGVDWRVDLGQVRKRLGNNVILQGNLDPCVLYGNKDSITQGVKDVLDANGSGPHIFNLGHGITPTVPVSHARHLVDEVKRLSLRPGA